MKLNALWTTLWVGLSNMELSLFFLSFLERSGNQPQFCLPGFHSPVRLLQWPKILARVKDVLSATLNGKENSRSSDQISVCLPCSPSFHPEPQNLTRTISGILKNSAHRICTKKNWTKKTLSAFICWTFILCSLTLKSYFVKIYDSSRPNPQFNNIFVVKPCTVYWW